MPCHVICIGRKVVEHTLGHSAVILPEMRLAFGVKSGADTRLRPYADNNFEYPVTQIWDFHLLASKNIYTWLKPEPLVQSPNVTEC